MNEEEKMPRTTATNNEMFDEMKKRSPSLHGGLIYLSASRGNEVHTLYLVKYSKRSFFVAIVNWCY